MELVDLVTGLLSRYEENRLWIVGSVRKHFFFRETDWSMSDDDNVPDRIQD